MSIPGGELAQEVAGFLQISTADRDRFQVYPNLNLAQIHLLNILDPRYLSSCIDTQTGDLTAGVGVYTWPTAWRVLRLLKVWVSWSGAVTDQNPGFETEIVSDTGIFQRCNLDRLPTVEHPQIGLGVASGFELRPVPAASVTGGYRARFVQRPEAISSSVVSGLNYELKPLLVYYATALSATVEGYSTQIHQEMMALYAEALEKYLPKSL